MIKRKKGVLAKKAGGFLFYGILTTFFCFSVHLLTPRQASWYHLAKKNRYFKLKFEQKSDIYTETEQKSNIGYVIS